MKKEVLSVPGLLIVVGPRQASRKREVLPHEYGNMVISNYSDTHEDVIYDIFDRKADVGAVKRTRLVRLAAEDPKVAKGHFTISRIPPVAENSPAVRPNLSALLKEQIRTVLLNMHEDPEGIKALREFKAHQFTAMTDSDFQPRSVYIRELGIDVHAERGATRP